MQSARDLSARTLKIYRLLLKVLLIDSALTVGCLGIPILSLSFAICASLSYTDLVFEISAVVITSYTMLSHAMTLYMIVPYRKAVHSMLQRWSHCIVQKTAQNTPSHSIK